MMMSKLEAQTMLPRTRHFWHECLLRMFEILGFCVRDVYTVVQSKLSLLLVEEAFPMLPLKVVCYISFWNWQAHN